MVTALAVLGVLLVLFVAAVLATSERPLLADVPPDEHDLALPDRPMEPDDVRALRFSMAARGYRMAQVDAALDRLRDELVDRDRRIALLEAAAEGTEPPAQARVATPEDLPVSPAAPDDEPRPPVAAAPVAAAPPAPVPVPSRPEAAADPAPAQPKPVEPAPPPGGPAAVPSAGAAAPVTPPVTAPVTPPAGPSAVPPLPPVTAQPAATVPAEPAQPTAPPVPQAGDPVADLPPDLPPADLPTELLTEQRESDPSASPDRPHPQP